MHRRSESSRVQDKKKLGLAKPEKSRNEICKKYSIHPSTLYKRMTGKVLGMGCQLGGARRGKILTADEFQTDTVTVKGRLP